jgi:hypothetical protein
MGVYVSFDDGSHWQPLQLNLPRAPVNDLVVKNYDLVVATHGRSFWVLDNITPLEQYNDSVPQQDAHLFTPGPASHTVFGSSPFASANAGKNPPEGAVIDYWLKTELKKPDEKKPSGDDAAKPVEPAAPQITLEILDSSGKVVRKFPKKPEEDEQDEGPGRQEKNAGMLPGDAGLNRFVWDLKYEGASKVPHAPLWAGNTDGPLALPGTYQVRLTVLGKSYTAPLEVKADPRSTVSQADLEKQFDLLIKVRQKVNDTDDTVNQIRDMRAQINAINKRLKDDPREKAISEAGKSLDKKMTEVEEALIQTKAKSGQDVLNFPIRLNNQLVALGGVVASADSAPTQQSYEVFDMLSKAVDEQTAKWKQIVATEVASYNNLVKQQDVPALMLMKASTDK